MVEKSIALLVKRQDLTREQAAETMRALMSGEAPSSQIAAFLVQC